MNMNRRKVLCTHGGTCGTIFDLRSTSNVKGYMFGVKYFDFISVGNISMHNTKDLDLMTYGLG